MDILILCKDCGEQFGPEQPNKIMKKILELSNSSKNISMQLSECMDICPKGKICTIILRGNQMH